MSWRSHLVERDTGYTTPCHEWTRSLTRKGYGQVRVAGRLWLVHRLVWIEAHGEPPAATPCVLHRCDNRRCGRLDHLFVGTKADNNRDMAEKGRSRRGEHGTSTHLTNSDIEAIRRDRRLQREIAADYGITQSAVSLIVNRKNWRHLP